MHRTTCNFLSLRKEWNSICMANQEILPTQHYDYYRYLWIIFCWQHLLTHWHIVFHCINDGHNRCIIPLAVNRNRKKVNGISFFGRLDYEDIVSSSSEPTFIKLSLRMVLSEYRGYHFYVNNIYGNGYLFRALYDHLSFDRNCVAITLPSSYDNYITSLSKHQRQNIRTSYNRLQHDNIAIQLLTFDSNHCIPHHLWLLCQKLYERRGRESGNALQLWRKRTQNAFSHILHHVEGHRIYVLMHGDVPIAYMAGMVKNNCFYVPRLSHELEYNKYSPGIVLICETVKVLIAEGINVLDLMRGEEPYKLAMGGTIHKNYVIDKMTNDILQ